MADRFPKDCWKKKCQHFHTRDLSIDDLVCTCDLLKVQCDACDEDWSFLLCPLPTERLDRKDCPMRHENGNCLPAGGFCTAVNDPICEALHNAYECGKSDLIDEYKKFMADKQISEPVKHGRWEYKGEQKGYFCSVCHSGYLLNMKSGWHLSKYCPHCGAYMDAIEKVISESHSETKVWEVK